MIMLKLKLKMKADGVATGFVVEFVRALGMVASAGAPSRPHLLLLPPRRAPTLSSLPGFFRAKNVASLPATMC